MKKRLKRNTDAEKKKNQSKARIFFFFCRSTVSSHSPHQSSLPSPLQVVRANQNEEFPVKANRWRISRDRRFLTRARVGKDNPAAPRSMEVERREPPPPPQTNPKTWQRVSVGANGANGANNANDFILLISSGTLASGPNL